MFSFTKNLNELERNVIKMRNYQNELLTSILSKADLREQLEAMEAQGITCLILPSQVEHKKL